MTKQVPPRLQRVAAIAIPEPPTPGSVVRLERQAAFITQIQIAEQVGVSRETIRLWEKSELTRGQAERYRRALAVLTGLADDHR